MNKPQLCALASGCAGVALLFAFPPQVFCGSMFCELSYQPLHLHQPAAFGVILIATRLAVHGLADRPGLWRRIWIGAAMTFAILVLPLCWACLDPLTSLVICILLGIALNLVGLALISMFPRPGSSERPTLLRRS